MRNTMRNTTIIIVAILCCVGFSQAYVKDADFFDSYYEEVDGDFSAEFEDRFLTAQGSVDDSGSAGSDSGSGYTTPTTPTPTPDTTETPTPTPTPTPVPIVTDIKVKSGVDVTMVTANGCTAEDNAKAQTALEDSMETTVLTRSNVDCTITTTSFQCIPAAGRRLNRRILNTNVDIDWGFVITVTAADANSAGFTSAVALVALVHDVENDATVKSVFASALKSEAEAEGLPTQDQSAIESSIATDDSVVLSTGQAQDDDDDDDDRLVVALSCTAGVLVLLVVLFGVMHVRNESQKKSFGSARATDDYGTSAVSNAAHTQPLTDNEKQLDDAAAPHEL